MDQSRLERRMRTRIALLTAALLVVVALLAVAIAAEDFRGRSVATLSAVSPEDVGLNWEECPATGSEYPTFGVDNGCFRHPWPDGSAVAPTWGTWLSNGELRLVIGQVTYTTTLATAGSLPAAVKETLYRNGEPVKSLTATMAADVPTVYLTNLDGKAAWEFAGGDVATVVYDGQDLREVYGVTEVRAPHMINGKLTFVARQGGRMFVVYDGHQVGPDFDEIFVGYCCDLRLFSVHYGRDSYMFAAKRAGKPYVVLITSASSAGSIGTRPVPTATLEPMGTVSAPSDAAATIDASDSKWLQKPTPNPRWTPVLLTPEVPGELPAPTSAP
jgi:hypothetical protein